jgi:glc operon protein GlcG
LLPIATAIIATAASGQTAGMLDARTAQAIVAGCAAHALAKQQSQAIAVVDTGGKLVAALRMDGNGSGSIDFAIKKAEAAAAWGFSTTDMAVAVKERVPGFANAPNVVTVGGGLPIWSADGKARIGAIGISGEREADDVDCAEAGVRAAGLRTTQG